MSYYRTPLRSKSEFECNECGCSRVEAYCWNCDEVNEKEELDPMRGVEFPFADNH